MDVKNNLFINQYNIFNINNEDININNINKDIFKNFGNINNNIYELKKDLNKDQINFNDKFNDLYLKTPFIDYYLNLNSNSNSNILLPQVNQFTIPQNSHSFLIEPINNKLNDKLNFINSSNELLINSISKNLIKNDFKKDNLK